MASLPAPGGRLAPIRQGWAGGLSWVLALALPLGASLAGSHTARPLLLNLGPGDSPYLTGFSPQYEIDDKVATHWTTYEAAVRLPVRLAGPAEVSYRFARVFPQSAVVEVEAAGAVIDRFTARGGLIEERRTMVGSGPAELIIRADSHERQDRGLRMDWIAWQPAPRTRVRLVGWALLAPPLLVALLLLLHRLLGFSGLQAGALTLPWAAALAAGLVLDPWLTHRLLRGLPLALLVFGAVGVVTGLGLHARGQVSASTVRTLGALCVATFLLRAFAVNHPDFYYPDLRTHARLVEAVAAAGLDFFVSPSRYIEEHGVWRTGAFGRTYAFPYSPAFHLPFTALRPPYDTLLLFMKLAGAALTVVPLVVVWALAGRAGLSPAGVALMVVIPTYTSRLSFAFLPSLLGHAVDMAFFFWLTGHLGEISRVRVFASAVVWVVACQLAYVSGVTNISLFVGLLAAAVATGALGASTAVARRDQPASTGTASPPLARRLRLDPRRALAILAFGLVGSLLSVALYYRDFLGMVADLLPRIAGQVPSSSRYPVRGFLEVAAGRTWDFFGVVHPVLAVLGLFRLFTRDPAFPGRRAVRVVAAAWLATYFFLLLGRARVPDVFLHGHETLLLTPLVCLAAGEALHAIWHSGRAGRYLAAGLSIWLTAQGLRLQWRAIFDQLANAR